MDAAHQFKLGGRHAPGQEQTHGRIDIVAGEAVGDSGAAIDRPGDGKSGLCHEPRIVCLAERPRSGGGRWCVDTW